MRNLMLCAIALGMIACGQTSLDATLLTCEYLSNPLAINTPSPHLGWQVSSTQDATTQSAYRILAASSREQLNQDQGTLWDTGVIQSNQSQQVAYQGSNLESMQEVFWKVMIWNQNNQPSPWSEIASFRIGKLSPKDWQAAWIGTAEDTNPDSTHTYPAPYLRHTFTTDKPIARALAYISGLGFYELQINGAKIGDQVLAPAVTNYDKRALQKLIYHYDDQSTQRVLYNVFDVTSTIQQGANALGVILGNGWYNQRERTIEGNMWYNTPRMTLQLELEFTDGTHQRIISSDAWRLATGGLRRDGIFTGEQYDARLEPEGWSLQNYDDKEWSHAKVVQAPSGYLAAQTAPFDRVMREFSPELVGKINDSTYRYALPEVISGWLHLRVKGKAGEQITLRFIGEEGEEFGQKDTYILKGGTEEQWHPRFTWHTFRYFEMTSPTLTPDRVTFVAESVHTDVRQTGLFHSSNELLNTLFNSYIRTQNANFHSSLSSDCPHRERLAYTGDGQVTVETCLYTYDMRQVYRKWLEDIDDARNHLTGYVPHTAPFGGGGGGPAWGSAYVIMPWAYYCFYKDKRILEQHYTGMKQWVAYLTTRTDARGIIIREEPNGWCLGDWCVPGGVAIPEALVNTAYYFHITSLMAQVAETLQKTSDAHEFQALAATIKRDFNAVFYHPEQGCYWQARQGSDVFPLAFGLVEQANIPKVVHSLVQHIKALDYHFDTGILATPLQLAVLSAHGHAEIAYRLMTQTTYPSFGHYLLDPQHTGMWEDWEGNQSYCHPMFGSVVAWFYRDLAGIKYAADKQGFVIEPTLLDQLNELEVACEVPQGRIGVRWNRSDDGKTTLNIEVPHNTQATLRLPSDRGWKVVSHPSITLDNGVVPLLSGNYHIVEQ